MSPLIALVTLSCAAHQQPAPHRVDYRHPPGGSPDSYSMVLDGVTYSSRASFTAAVATLPPHSRLVWYSGCIAFDEIPLGPAPRMTIPEFKSFCSNHRIRFDYQCGLLPDPLITKTFSVSRALRSERTDARQWLETQGVTFPPKATARWDARKQQLTARNTQENLELIALIIEHTKPK
jgi:hypothetical protein